MSQTAKSTVIIQDKELGDKSIKAPIINFDKAQRRITIDGKYFPADRAPMVSMLIIEKNSITECQGIVRKMDINGKREITIFNVKTKEDRSADRYDMNVKAIIESLIIADKTIPSEPLIEVTIKNLGANGALVNTNSTMLGINSSFVLKLNMGGNTIKVKATVVRIAGTAENGQDLGCRFIEIME